MERYISEGYPKSNGLSTTPIMVRNHNHSDTIKHNEDWWSEIKQAIDEYVSEGKLEIVTKIGYPKGTHFHMSKSTNTTSDKVLADSEGLICRVL